MIDNPIEINNIQLPSLFSAFLKSEKSGNGYWQGNGKKNLWYSMFPKEEIDSPKLYAYPLLVKTNGEWINEKREIFLGKADGIVNPGTLNPQKSLLIGELAQDNLVALDFSASSTDPSISYLKWYAPNTMRWTLAVADLATFFKNLDILL